MYLAYNNDQVNSNKMWWDRVMKLKDLTLSEAAAPVRRGCSQLGPLIFFFIVLHENGRQQITLGRIKRLNYINVTNL